MSKTDPLLALEADFARQDESFRLFEKTLLGLGDVELRVPPMLLEQLDEATKPTPIPPPPPPCGVRA